MKLKPPLVTIEDGAIDLSAVVAGLRCVALTALRTSFSKAHVGLEAGPTGAVVDEGIVQCSLSRCPTGPPLSPPGVEPSMSCGKPGVLAGADKRCQRLDPPHEHSRGHNTGDEAQTGAGLDVEDWRRESQPTCPSPPASLPKEQGEGGRVWETWRMLAFFSPDLL